MGDDPNPPAIGWTEDDARMADLRAWLVERGFAVLSDRYDPSPFGDQEVVFTRPIAIRLVRDRGQWSVDVAGADGQFVDIRRWRDALRGPGAQVLSGAEQADILRELLGSTEAHPSPPDEELAWLTVPLNCDSGIGPNDEPVAPYAARVADYRTMKSGSDLDDRPGDPPDDRRANRQREPIRTEVAMVIAGPILVAIGYLIQFNDIPYAPGDSRGTPAYGAESLAFAAIAGFLLVVVGSIRLVQALRDRHDRR